MVMAGMNERDAERVAFVAALLDLMESRGVTGLSVDGVSIARTGIVMNADAPEDKDAAKPIQQRGDRVNGDHMDEDVLFASAGG